LRANGVPIVPSILDKVFPASARKKPTPQLASDDIKAVKPVGGARRFLLAIVRELLTETNRTERVTALGPVGAKLLHLPRDPLGQVTLIVNSRRPSLTYTCILPQRLGLPKSAKNKMVFAQIEGRVAGVHAIWLVIEIRVL
jgi:hypothetical protein